MVGVTVVVPEGEVQAVGHTLVEEADLILQAGLALLHGDADQPLRDLPQLLHEGKDRVEVITPIYKAVSRRESFVSFFVRFIITIL